MKREFPLFIVDHNRAHKFGEVDFIYCSDIDNGFIAKVEYIDGIIEEVGEDYRIEPGLSGSNISAKISIKRITGKNPDKTKIRGLLKQAMKYYTSLSTFSADIGNITVRQMVLFIDTLILNGRRMRLQPVVIIIIGIRYNIYRIFRGDKEGINRSMTIEELSKQVRKIREGKGLTQYNIWKQGMNFGTVIAIESGKNVNLNNYLKYCEIVGIDVTLKEKE